MATQWFLQQNEFESYEALKGFPDLERSLQRLLMQRFFPRDLNNIQKALNIYHKIKPFIEQAPFFKDIDFTNLHLKIDSYLSTDLPTSFESLGFINKGVNEKLDNLSFMITNANQVIEKLAEEYRLQTGIQSLKIKQNNLIGYFIEVTKIHEAKVPNNFVKKQSTINASRYVTPELMDTVSQLQSAEYQALAIQKDMLDELVNSILESGPQLKVLAHLISFVDLHLNHAYFVKNHYYCCPVVSKDKHLHITKGRHPVVEKVMQSFTPNDCNLQLPFALLTGPNMAGKSTYLRQNALIIWLAHCGLHVPAEKAVIGEVDCIFSRVGAGDDLAQGKSTFMVEMSETAMILNQATEKSFVIFDEIGRGTSTTDGYALAKAISLYVIEDIKCRCLFATHYHELKELTQKVAITTLTLEILHHNDDLIFTHKVIPGHTDKSYGLNVAKLAGLPEAVLKKANQFTQTVTTHHIDAEIVEAEIANNVFIAPKDHPAIDILRKQNVDELSPKQAHDLLYKLKNLSDS